MSWEAGSPARNISVRIMVWDGVMDIRGVQKCASLELHGWGVGGMPWAVCYRLGELLYLVRGFAIHVLVS